MGAEVANSAVEEFEAARWSGMRWGTRWKPAEDALCTDLARCCAVLEAAGLQCSLSLFSLEEQSLNMWHRPERSWCFCCRKQRVHATTSDAAGRERVPSLQTHVKSLSCTA